MVATGGMMRAEALFLWPRPLRQHRRDDGTYSDVHTVVTCKNAAWGTRPHHRPHGSTRQQQYVDRQYRDIERLDIRIPARMAWNGNTIHRNRCSELLCEHATQARGNCCLAKAEEHKITYMLMRQTEVYQTELTASSNKGSNCCGALLLLLYVVAFPKGYILLVS